MKSNYIDHVWTYLLFVIGGIITLILITMGIAMWEPAKDAAVYTTSQMNKYSIYIQEADIMKYDGLEVEGSDVVNFIKNNLGEYSDSSLAPFTVTVTYSNKTTIHRDNTNIKYISNFTHEYFIKPTVNFLGSVIKNENGVIVNVTFEQY